MSLRVWWLACVALLFVLTSVPSTPHMSQESLQRSVDRLLHHEGPFLLSGIGFEPLGPSRTSVEDDGTRVRESAWVYVSGRQYREMPVLVTVRWNDGGHAWWMAEWTRTSRLARELSARDSVIILTWANVTHFKEDLVIRGYDPVTLDEKYLYMVHVPEPRGHTMAMVMVRTSSALKKVVIADHQGDGMWGATYEGSFMGLGSGVLDEGRDYVPASNLLLTSFVVTTGLSVLALLWISRAALRRSGPEATD